MVPSTNFSRKDQTVTKAHSIAVSDIPDLVETAHTRTAGHIHRTPLQRSNYFSSRTGANVFFKLEQLQVSGSFKGRGAMNKIASLSDAERARGIVAASTGNHGAAVAYAANAFGAKSLIFMPENASSVKVDAVRGLGAEVRFHSSDAGQTEIYAHAFADERGLTFASPYNDPAIIGGQGTIGKELLEQIGQVDELFLSVGGGGLLSGIAGYLKGIGQTVRVCACSPQADHAMYASIKAGKVVVFDADPTIADGCAGGMEEDAITLPLVTQLVDEWHLLSEEATKAAMRLYIENDNHLLEGSAGLAIAALLEAAERGSARFEGKTVVLVICGSRISAKTLKSLL